MASTTSLLKTQKSRQQAIWDQEDAIADYEWSLSDKSPEALAAYNAHYQDRANNPQADPSKALTYVKKQTAANKAYTSNEIQRASIDIIEGRQPEEYKIGVLENLYTNAYQNGDMDLAQSLRLQIDNQYVKMQTAALAAQNAAGGGGGGGTTTADKELIKQINAFNDGVKNGTIPFDQMKGLTVADLANVLNSGGLEDAKAILDQAAGGPDGVAKIFGDPNVNPVQALAGMLSSVYDSAAQLVGQISDPVEREQAMSKLNQQAKTDKIMIGGKQFTLDELKTESDNISNGNPSMRFVSGPNGLMVQGRPAVEYSYQWDENGNPVIQAGNLGPEAQATYGDQTVGATDFGYPAGAKVYYRITKDGTTEVIPYAETVDKNGKDKLANDKKAITADNFIAAAGFVKSPDGKSYLISDPTLRQQLMDKGITESALTSDSFVVNPDGKVQFKTSDGQLFQLVTDSFGKEGKGVTHIYDVRPGSVQDFYSGGRTASGTTNLLNQQMMTNLQSNLSGSAFQGANTSRLVQPAGGASGILQQAATARQLNQLQMAQNEQLRVAALPKAPAISVQSYPAPTPIKVNTTIQQYPIKVTSPTVQPIKVTATQPTAPTSGAVQGSGIKLQGGSGSLQGGTGYLQGGFSGTLRVQ